MSGKTCLQLVEILALPVTMTKKSSPRPTSEKLLWSFTIFIGIYMKKLLLYLLEDKLFLIFGLVYN